MTNFSIYPKNYNPSLDQVFKKCSQQPELITKFRDWLWLYTIPAEHRRIVKEAIVYREMILATWPSSWRCSEVAITPEAFWFWVGSEPNEKVMQKLREHLQRYVTFEANNTRWLKVQRLTDSAD